MQNRPDAVTAAATHSAIESGFFESLLCLHARAKCGPHALRLAADYRRYEIFQWLCREYLDQLRQLELEHPRDIDPYVADCIAEVRLYPSLAT